VTLSLGIAEFPTHASELAELIEFADQALYAAKRGGRNRSVMYSSAEVSVVPGRG
jgi:diguanylate cyclase (GGDEF)-like protein